MSSAAAWETQARCYVRGAFPSYTPSSADEGFWARVAEGAAAPGRRGGTDLRWPS